MKNLIKTIDHHCLHGFHSFNSKQARGTRHLSDAVFPQRSLVLLLLLLLVPIFPIVAQGQKAIKAKLQEDKVYFTPQLAGSSPTTKQPFIANPIQKVTNESSADLDIGSLIKPSSSITKPQLMEKINSAKQMSTDVPIYTGIADQRTPQIVANGNEMYVAFDNYDMVGGSFPYGYIDIYKSTDAGNSWSYWGYISSQSYHLYSPQIVLVGGDIIVSYQRNGALRTFRFDPANEQLNPDVPVPVVSTSEYIVDHKMVTDAQEYSGTMPYLYMAYLFKQLDGRNSVLFCISKDTARTWSTYQELGLSQSELGSTSIGLDYSSSGLYLAYLGTDASAGSILMRKSILFGLSSSWTPEIILPMNVNGGKNKKVGPMVSAMGKRVAVIYQYDYAGDATDWKTGSDFDVYADVSDDGGASWQEREVSWWTGVDEILPNVTSDLDGNFYVSFIQDGKTRVSMAGSEFAFGYSDSSSTANVSLDDFPSIFGSNVSGTKTAYTTWTGLSNGLDVYGANVALKVPPLSPTILVASVVSSTQIKLSWNDNSTDETGFIILLRAGGTTGTWSKFATPAPPNTTSSASFQVTGLTPSTFYEFYVYAYNANGNSLLTNIVSATTVSVESILRLAPFFISGQYLNDQIAADTLANGKLPDRVYVLQRGGIYRANSDFTNTNWTLRIRANDSTTTQKPVIFLFPSLTTGALPGQFINVSGNVELKNLIISGYYEPADTNLRSLKGTLLRIPTTTSGWNIAIDSCILSNTDGQHISTDGAASVIKVTNTVFANMGYLGRSNLGAGRAIDLRANAIDTVIVQNCTFVNSQDRIIRHLGVTSPYTTSPMKYLLFDHNTLVNGMGYHGVLALGNVSERAIITNNLLLDPFSLGNDTDYTRQLSPEFGSSGEKDLYGGNRMTWIFSEPNQTAFWTISNNYYGISDSGLAFYNKFASAGVTGEGSPLTWHISSRLGADSVNAFKKVYIVPQKTPTLMTKLMRWYRSPSGGNKTKNTPTAWVFGDVNTHPYIDPYDFDRKGYEWLLDSLNCSYQASVSPTSTDGKVVGDTRWRYNGIIGINTAPAAPQNLFATAGNGQVTLKWNKNKESDFLRYRIYRGTSSNPTTKVDSSTASILDTVKLITGLTNSTTYYFRITAVDNAGLESGFSNEVNATPSAVVDITPPVFTTSPYITGGPIYIGNGGVVSGAVQVNASASDGGSGISRMQVAYRNTSEQSWSYSPYVSATSISFSIPTNKFVYNNKPIGVNYRVGAWDIAGNVTWSPYNSIDVQLGPQVTDKSFDMPAASQLSNKTTAYRMISVPYDLSNKQPVNLLSNFGSHMENNISYARWRFQRYVNGQYQDYDQFSQTNAVIPGAAFFFIVRDQGSQIVVQGASVVRSDVMYNTGIQLQSGWNLVGNPFNISYPIDSLEFYATASSVSQPIRQHAYYSGTGPIGGWDTSSASVYQIKPWEGVALYVNNAGTLKFPSTGQRSGLPKTSRVSSVPSIEKETAGNWTLAVNAYRSDIDMHCEGSSLGMAQGANEGDDPYDSYIPPIVGDKNVAVYFKNADGAMMRDIRPPNEDGDVWEMRVVTGDAGVKVKLQWGNNLNLPNPAFEAYLIDNDQKMAHNLKEVQSLEINSGNGMRNFRVIVGKKSFVEGNNAGVALTPSSMKLYANYPNPFNPETVIRYTVPDASASYTVTLKIFNVLGQEITTLVNEQKSSGYYEVKWNALQQSSGIYFYRLSITDGSKTFQDIKKMVLMK
ncbi:MAG: fibronectin type III domain-containing protein [Bacteroidota bacterium]